MDGGANICLTGILSLLVDVVSIPPLPISITTISGALSLDDCSHFNSRTAQYITNSAIFARTPQRPSSLRKPSLPQAISSFAGNRKAIRMNAWIPFGSLVIVASQHHPDIGHDIW
jgi:hypothetical protein